VNTKAGNVSTGAVTVTGPSISINLKGLLNATKKANSDPNALVKALSNFMAKLPVNSPVRQAVEQVYAPNKPVPTVKNVQEAIKTANNKVAARVQMAQKFRQTPPPNGKNLKNMSFGELVSLRKKGKDLDKIDGFLRRQVETKLKEIDRKSSSERGWMLGELYKSLPEKFPGKEKVLRAIQKEVRETSRGRDPVNAERRLRDLYSNLGMKNRLPREIKSEFKLRSDNVKKNYQRRYSNRPPMRNFGNYAKPATPGLQALRQGQAKQKNGVRLAPLTEGGALKVPGGSAPAIFAGPKPLTNGTSLLLPPGLPRNALRQAGGVAAVNRIVSNVPGGLHAVATAAAHLNETNGNVKKAQQNRGVSPAAVDAVKRLGGHTKAAYALEGLHLIHKKTRRAKKTPVRTKAINNTLRELNKLELKRLVRKNVTHRRLVNVPKKKRLRSILKSWILKKPLANSVKNAARAKK
jgi:hypothetical protein